VLPNGYGVRSIRWFKLFKWIIQSITMMLEGYVNSDGLMMKALVKMAN
jgi:hypothetical protein